MSKFRDMLESKAGMSEAEAAVFLAAIPRGRREDDEGKEYEVLLYEDYVAMMGR